MTVDVARGWLYPSTAGMALPLSFGPPFLCTCPVQIIVPFHHSCLSQYCNICSSAVQEDVPVGCAL